MSDADQAERESWRAQQEPATGAPTHCRVLISDVLLCAGELRGIAGQLRDFAIKASVDPKSPLSPDELAQAAVSTEALITRLQNDIHEATRLRETDPTLPPLPVPHVGTRWSHFKGRVYQITDLVTHSETKELMVVYAEMDGPNSWGGPRWVRPLSMWHDAEPKMGGRRRFELIAEKQR